MSLPVVDRIAGVSDKCSNLHTGLSPSEMGARVKLSALMHAQERIALAGDAFVHDTILEMHRHVTQGRHVIVHGPAGTGVNVLLERAARYLATHRVAANVVRGDDPRIEMALGQLSESRGHIFAGIESHRTPVPLVTSLASASTDGEVSSAIHLITLTPLSDPDMARFVHQQSERPLDSTVVSAIVRLAHGRIEWANALIALAQEDLITGFPFPAIKAEVLPQYALDVITPLASCAGNLSPEEVAAAIAIADIEPIDLDSARTILGQDTVVTLQNAGVLAPWGEREVYTVPGPLATALAPQTTPQRVAAARTRIADALAGLEAFGLPLDPNDTIVCARSFELECVADPSAHLTIVQRAISLLTTAGDAPQVRSLVLRYRAHVLDFDPAVQARMLILFGQYDKAQAVLEEWSEGCTPEESVLRHFLIAHISGSHGDTQGGQDGAMVALCGAVNREGGLADPLGKQLTALAEGEIQEPRAFAEAMIDLEAAWWGRIGRSESWVATGGPLPLPDPFTPRVLHDIVSATLIAQGLTAVLAAGPKDRFTELMDAASRLETDEMHRALIGHLAAAGTALACGDLTRTLTEWELFAARVPPLLPHRLASYISDIGDVLRTVILAGEAGTMPVQLRRNYPYRYVLYLAGEYDRLISTPKPTPDAHNLLPNVRLMHAHLRAWTQENPIELMRLGDQLRAHSMLDSSRRALTEARRIFLSRRATGNVRKCDAKLAELAEQIAAWAPWKSQESTPERTRVPLTGRELETARLAAEGLTNRQIAEQLQCSVRTVESHIAQARAKLGASSRRELADLLPAED